jgi:hypothetical protein
VLADLLQEAGFVVWREVMGLYGPFPEGMSAADRGGVADGTKRRMDLVAINNNGLLLIDPTVVDQATPDRVRADSLAAEVDYAAAANAAEKQKIAHYRGGPSGSTFTPVAMGTQCSAGTRGYEFLKLLGYELACSRNGTRTPSDLSVSFAVREVRERVGVAILRKMANIIINAIKGVPHPALLEARKHLHTAYRPVEGQWQKVGDDCQPDDGPPVWGEAGGRVVPLPALEDARLHLHSEGRELPEELGARWEQEGRLRAATAGRTMRGGEGSAAASARQQALAQ